MVVWAVPPLHPGSVLTVSFLCRWSLIAKMELSAECTRVQQDRSIMQQHT
jgi:hypothetical protein